MLLGSLPSTYNTYLIKELPWNGSFPLNSNTVQTLYQHLKRSMKTTTKWD